MSICGNAAGGFGFPKTLMLVDKNGNEMTGVVVGEEQIFTATPADVRIGKTFASDEGVSEGENTITYRTQRGTVAIPDGKIFSIPLSYFNTYDYTHLHCMIAPYNTNLCNSVSVDKIAIYNGVYAAGSTEQVSSITKDSNSKTINLNITNNSGLLYVVHFFTYKEEEV